MYNEDVCVLPPLLVISLAESLREPITVCTVCIALFIHVGPALPSLHSPSPPPPLPPVSLITYITVVTEGSIKCCVTLSMVMLHCCMVNTSNLQTCLSLSSIVYCLAYLWAVVLSILQERQQFHYFVTSPRSVGVIHVHTLTHVHTHINTYMYVYTYACTHTHTHAHSLPIHYSLPSSPSMETV